MPPKKKDKAEEGAVSSATSDKKKKGKAESPSAAANKSANKSTAGSTTSAAPSFPSKIGKGCTIAQLGEEAKARGMDLGNVIKYDKPFLLGLLGEGSISVVALATKAGKTGVTGGAKSVTAANTKAAKSVTAKAAPAAAAKSYANSPPKAPASSKTKNAVIKTPSEDEAASEDEVAATKKMTATEKAAARKRAYDAVIGKGKAAAKDDKPNKKAKKDDKPPKKDNKSPAGKNQPSVRAFAVPILPKYASAPKKVSAKASATSAVSGAATLSSTATGPNGRKNPAAAPPAYPRISNKLSLAQLKEEAMARQLDPKHIPKLKAGLLLHLVDGSIHVKETQVKDYQLLLEQVKSEEASLYQDFLEEKEIILLY